MPDLARVDRHDGRAPCGGFLSEMLEALGLNPGRLAKPHDLPEFKRRLDSLKRKLRIGLTFDLVVQRADQDVYLFASLGYFIADHKDRPLTLCIQSRVQFRELLPRESPLSEIDCARETLSAVQKGLGQRHSAVV